MKANIDKIILNPEIATYNNYKWIATFYKNRNAKNNIEIYTKKLESFFDTLKHFVSDIFKEINCKMNKKVVI